MTQPEDFPWAGKQHEWLSREKHTITWQHMNFISATKVAWLKRPAPASASLLGEHEIRMTKHHCGCSENVRFLAPDGVRERFQAGIVARELVRQAGWRRV
jgi:hypothetical protein